jgi:hypothetical protein
MGRHVHCTPRNELLHAPPEPCLGWHARKQHSLPLRVSRTAALGSTVNVTTDGC